VAFSEGLGYADPMEYEHEWDKDLHPSESTGNRPNVTNMMKERSMYGWELVSVVLIKRSIDADGYDLFWKKPKKDRK